ncbi:hypothetical protein [Serratia fonticola]|uniref:hypothetical protein n=1 Tax=Serratia fonticola TaxID=47917 RepID=UPI002DB7C5E8|nr:hypothetical protein [Serratia fonticola]MEB7884042.1 hypothetical protein [Serratia fonticola]
MNINSLQDYLDYFGYDASDPTTQFTKCGNVLNRSLAGDETAFNTMLEEEKYLFQQNNNFDYDETVMKK